MKFFSQADNSARRWRVHEGPQVTQIQRETARAGNVTALERRGGRIQLTNCRDKKRLCALIDPMQFNSDGSTTRYGDKGEYWIILKGY